MASAKVTQIKNGDVLNIEVSGYIGENADLFVLNFTGVKKVVVDLKGVNYMNSVGVRNWIIWMARFPKDITIQMVNCPPLIINQVNMVVGFVPTGATIESLFAPFVCNDCNREETALLKRDVEYRYATNDKPAAFRAPDIKCPKCSKPMEFDAIESKFFNFLKAQKS